MDIGYLALTPILFVISNSYYYNDEMIGNMNRYISQNLGPRIAASAGCKAEEIFQWETFVRATRRVRRRVYQFIANLILYPGASAASLAFFASRRDVLNQTEQIAILICSLMTGLMLIQVMYHADLLSRR